MAYVLVENFSGGVDRSRPRYVSPPGTLWAGINGHISRGGDFEKRKAFAVYANLPAGKTIGLSKTDAGLIVFGSDEEPPAMPTGVSYQRLQHPDDNTIKLTKVRSDALFAGKLYVVAEFENGDVRHFYDGAVVSDWDSGDGKEPSGYGSFAFTFGRKMYSPVGSILWFSKLDDPSDWNIDSSGAGFQNMQSHQSGSDAVTALGNYQSLLAVFARRVIQLWSMQADTQYNAPVQVLTETGTRARRSVIGFGDVDAFYLSDSGIRSIRARSGTDVAGINDVGTPIDTLVREWIESLTDDQIADAIALIEPIDGRLWMAIGSRIFVFSYFPSKKISAWTWYEPGFTPTEMVTRDDRVYVRSGDTIYLYGGADGNTFGDDYDVVAELPFLSGGKPGTFKAVKGFDIAAMGAWDCRLLVNPRDENEFVDVGELDGITWEEEGIGVPVHCTHFAPVLVHRGKGFASLSQIGIHTDGAEAKI